MPSLEISNVFTQSLQSAQGLIADPGTNFYVPPYQRPFAWGDENFERLMADIGAEVERVNRGDDANAVAYLGSVIVVPDITFEYVKPIFKADMPGGVLHIIDGQQRTTTIVILAAFLATEGSRILQKLKGLHALAEEAGHAELHGWLCWQVEDLSKELQAMLGSKRASADERYRIVPKIIRAQHDQWGRSEQVAKYDSAIARFLWEYDHFLSQPYSKRFAVSRFAERAPSNLLRPEYERFEDALKELQKLVKRLFERRTAEGPAGFGDDESSEMPSAEQLARGRALQVLCQPADSCDFASALNISKLGTAVGDALVWLVFGRFMLGRVIVSKISAMRHEYAFDLFDSLNTTGAPLTAFETFKAEAMSTVAPSRLAASSSRSALERVEAVLESGTSGGDRQALAAELFTSFAASETGFKLGRSPREQRHWLRKRYRSSTGDEREAMLLHIASCAEWGHFVDGLREGGEPPSWIPETNRLWSGGIGPMEKGLLRSLQRAKHSIVWPVLQRFAASAIESDDADGWADLNAAIRAVSGFSLLWRGAHVGTKSIDAHYRGVMRYSAATEGAAEKLGLARLANPPKRLLPELKRQLQGVLSDAGIGIGERATWCSRVAACDAYSLGEFARLLLFVAHDDVILQLGTAKLARGKTGASPLLACLDVLAATPWSIEHIAPQSPRHEDGWNASLYGGVPVTHVNRLGNLTLLPKEWNSSIGNRSWTVKRGLFGALSTPDPLEAERQLKHLGLESLRVPPMAVQAGRTLLPMLASIAAVDEWSLDRLDQRSLVLAELVADRVYHWVY